MNFLDEIKIRRSSYPRIGGNSNRLVERVGAVEVLYQFYEPSPETTREKYYYNTRLNRLYLKMTSKNPITGKSVNVWKLVSEY